MRALIIAGCLVILSTSGCASMKADSTHPPGAGEHAARSPEAGPRSDSGAPPAASADRSDAPGIGAGTSTAKAEQPAAAPAPQRIRPSTTSNPPKTKSSTTDRPSKKADASSPRASSVAPAPANKAPAAPTLDLATLEQRLRDTRAIGVFTKLSLKNQVDDLLNEFRTLYSGSSKHPPPELRQRYDALLLKVLGLLQDSDPALATAISSSREAIWGILADPDKFANLRP
ncbi:MAG: hypothetical protein JWN43_1677 [Gammaproteobacteria bacterium]|nr:hypothetical protein [Gammaproteobacteria bacterium]